MTDIEGHDDVQLTSEERTPVGQQVDKCGEESDWTESLQYTDQGEDRLLLLANVALLPPCGEDVPCSSNCEACSCMEVRCLVRNLQPMQLQLQFLLSRAESFINRLVNGQASQSGVAPADEVQRFLYTCQPYFNHVESTVRSKMSLDKHLPFDISSKLLDFSQQLCDRLEQLVLTLASDNLVCLDEAKPDSISHFCIGQSHLERLRLTAFRYCKLTPYLSQVNTGLYKRMRWNVERLQDDMQQAQQHTDEEDSGEREEETDGDTEYYFLCCEEIPHLHSEAARESHGVSIGDVKVWSIGQWVQVNPDPDTEDILDWIMCDVPQASYDRLLFLGSDEPSSFTATDHLRKLLMLRLDTRAI